MVEDEAFKVTDRRHRDEPAEKPPAPAQAPPAPAGPTEAAAPSARTAPSHGGPDLQGLFIMLASSALVNLGEAADPETDKRRLDLDQAKEAIDLLLLLRSKTEGNRTAQESHLLDEMLYDLQLRFVRASKGAGGG